MIFSAKRFKSFICAMLALVMVFGSVVVIQPQEVVAATSVQVPSDVRCGVGMQWAASFRVYLVAKGDKIAKLKSSSKNLVAKVTYNHNNSTNPYADITYYAKKKGTYKLKFDVRTSYNSKRTSRTVKVHAAGTDLMIDKVTINGKAVKAQGYELNEHFTTKKNGKVKFTMPKGCKIKKIQVVKYDQNGNSVPKNFKNGKKVTFGVYGNSTTYNYTSPYNSYYNYNYWNRGMWAYTRFNITYRDSFYNAERTVSYFIVRKATRWY